MRSLSFVFTALLASAVVPGCVSSAQPGEAHAMRNGYNYLGERWVNGGADHDVIQVGRADGKFNSIMVVVENAPVEVFDITVDASIQEALPAGLVEGLSQYCQVSGDRNRYRQFVHIKPNVARDRFHPARLPCMRL